MYLFKYSKLNSNKLYMDIALVSKGGSNVGAPHHLTYLLRPGKGRASTRRRVIGRRRGRVVVALDWVHKETAPIHWPISSHSLSNRFHLLVAIGRPVASHVNRLTIRWARVRRVEGLWWVLLRRSHRIVRLDWYVVVHRPYARVQFKGIRRLHSAQISERCWMVIKVF